MILYVNKSTPIYEASLINDSSQSPLNYILSNTQEWMNHQIVNNTAYQNTLLPFFMFLNQEDWNINNIDLNHQNNCSPRKYQSVALSSLNNNGTKRSLLISTAQFSDQFTASS